MSTANDIIQLLKLDPHPEGGFFREMYKGVVSSIYYLHTRTSHSKMHRLKSDEIYHHYAGASVELLVLDPNGNAQVVILGSDISAGEVPQFLVPAGTWQGSRIARSSNEHDFALLGTTVAPAFQWSDLEFADINELLTTYPTRSELIKALC